MKGSLWSTRLGIYFAAVGSAVGLGNIWRFPFVVSENGGGAFVLIYIFLGLVVGVPILICELMIGRLTRKGVLCSTKELISSSHSLSKPKWMKNLAHFGSYLTIVVAFLMLAYILLISSWVLFFLVHFCKTLFVELPVAPDQLMLNLKSNFIGQLLFLIINLFIVMTVVIKGRENTFEKGVSYLFPVFLILLFFLAYKSLSLDVSMKALQYYFYPDFSKLKFSSLSYALGQVFFTLSIGLGLTIGFGRYLRPKSNIPLTGYRVATIDSTVSIFAGLIVFPLVFSGLFSADGVGGPALVFETVPGFLVKINNGTYYGIALFLCLFLSALGACVGLLGTVVSNIKESKKTNHIKTCFSVAAAALVFSLIPTSFISYLSDYKLFDKTLFEFFDIVIVNVLLPISCYLVIFIAYKFIDKQTRRAEFFGQENSIDFKMFDQWMFAIKYLIPFIYILSFGLLIYGLSI